MELYEQASRQGDTEATFALARVAEGAGQVAKRNLTRAAELYWEAVEMAPSERFAAAPLLVSPSLEWAPSLLDLCSGLARTSAGLASRFGCMVWSGLKGCKKKCNHAIGRCIALGQRICWRQPSGVQAAFTSCCRGSVVLSLP